LVASAFINLQITKSQNFRVASALKEFVLIR
jgi:hypothetical protein